MIQNLYFVTSWLHLYFNSVFKLEKGVKMTENCVFFIMFHVFVAIATVIRFVSVQFDLESQVYDVVELSV